MRFQVPGESYAPHAVRENGVAAEHGIAVDRFTRTIVRILKAASSALEAAECQSVGSSISRAHTSPRLRPLLAAAGGKRWYLPTDAPDESSSEVACSRIKAELRAVGARTKAALEAAVAQAFTHVSPQEAQALFRHCGFHLRPDLRQWFCP